MSTDCAWTPQHWMCCMTEMWCLYLKIFWIFSNIILKKLQLDWAWYNLTIANELLKFLCSLTLICTKCTITNAFKIRIQDTYKDYIYYLKDRLREGSTELATHDSHQNWYYFTLYLILIHGTYSYPARCELAPLRPKNENNTLPGCTTWDIAKSNFTITHNRIWYKSKTSLKKRQCSNQPQFSFWIN